MIRCHYCNRKAGTGATLYKSNVEDCYGIMRKYIICEDCIDRHVREFKIDLEIFV